MMEKKIQDNNLQWTVFPLLRYDFNGSIPIDGNLQYYYCARYAFGQSYDSIIRASEIQMSESDRNLPIPELLVRMHQHS